MDLLSTIFLLYSITAILSQNCQDKTLKIRLNKAHSLGVWVKYFLNRLIPCNLSSCGIILANH